MAVNLESCAIRVFDANGKTHGTGFLVSDSLAVTCAHVVKLCDVSPGGRVRVVFYANGESREADVLLEPFWQAPDADDVAMLRLLPDGQALPLGVTSITLGSTRNSARHRIQVFGFPPLPGRYDTVWADGTIRGVVPHPDKRPMLQMDVQPIRQGMSGAPVLDLDTKRVVGMVSEFLRDEPLEWATTSDTLAAICDELKLHPPQAVEDYLKGMKEYNEQLPYLTLNNVQSFKNFEKGYFQLQVQLRRRKTEDEPVSIDQVVQNKEHAHVLIFGEPGAGKSTLLRQLALHAWTAPETIGLNEPHLPILVSLSQFVGVQGGLEERLNRALVQEKQVSEELPKGFFTDWSLLTGRRWLILLDALDEVPENGRKAILKDFRLMLRDWGQNRIVITSRPSVHISDDFDNKMFGQYDLLPVTPEQIGAFALKWFGDQAEAFLQELKRVVVGALSGTPLLLTIAARVYLEKHTLPERRSALYAQFVDVWLSEAEERGLNSELGERLAAPTDIQLARLAHLALRMTEQPGKAALETLAGFVAEHLRDEEEFTRLHAETYGKQFVEVMARRSGAFLHHDDLYEWIHPTFREHLTAYTIVWECEQDLECIWNQAVARWAEENWREVSLFALGLLSDAGKDVSGLVERPLSAGYTGLYFSGHILAEQVTVQDATRRRIIEGLFEQARAGLGDSRTTDILSKLRSNSQVKEGLLALALDERLLTDVLVRRDAASALSKLGFVEEAIQAWLVLAQKRGMEPPVRLEAAEELVKLGRVEEAIQTWIELAWGSSWGWRVESSVRLRAAEGLSKVGQSDKALQILSALGVDRRAEGWVRRLAAEALGKLGRVEEAAGILVTLARDERVEAIVRLSAAKSLSEMGRVDEAVGILLAEAQGGPMWVREFEQRLIRNEVTLSPTWKGYAGTWVRVRAIEMLGVLGDARMLPDLEQIAREDADEEVREATQKAIEAIRREVESSGEESF